MKDSFKQISKVILFIFIISLTKQHTSYTFSQVVRDFNDFSLFFGDRTSSKGYLQTLDRTHSGDIISIQNNTSLSNMFSRRKANFTFGLVEDYTLPSKKPVKFLGDGRMVNLLFYSILGEKVLAASYKRESARDEYSFYYHYIDPKSNSKNNHGFKISDDFGIGYKSMDPQRLMMADSKNKEYTSILYFPNTKEGQLTQITYLTFNKDAYEPSIKSVIIPYPSDEYSPIDFSIKNQDEQYLIIAHQEKDPKGNFITDIYNKIRIYTVSQDTFSTSVIDGQEKYFTDIYFTLEDNGAILTALYQTQVDGNTEGILTAKFDSNGHLSNEYYSSFPADLQYLINTTERLNLESNLNYGNTKNGFKILNSYNIDDSYLSIIEYSALEYRQGSIGVAGGTSVVERLYWSNDLIVCKINSEGEIEWINKIPKTQRTINDGGYYLSTTNYLVNDKLHLFFNDNLANYSKEDYNFIKGEESTSIAQFNSIRNTIAHVSIDLQDGKQKREAMVGKSETNVLFIPRLSVQIPGENRLVIFGSNMKKYRIGKIFFSDN